MKDCLYLKDGEFEVINNVNTGLRIEGKAVDELIRYRKLKSEQRIIELPMARQDTNDALEPIKLKSALQSEIMKMDYRKQHAPETINRLDYTIIAALTKLLEGF